MTRIIVVSFGICGFLVAGSARADLQADLNNVGNNPGAKLLVLQGQDVTVGAAGLHVPDEVTILATGAQITSVGFIKLGSGVKIIGGDWEFRHGGFLSECDDRDTLSQTDDLCSSRITYEGVTVVSEDASAALHRNGDGLTVIDSNMTGRTNGLYADAMNNVVVRGGKYNNSGRNGILLSGGADHLIDPDEASDNVSASGINLARAMNVKIGSPLCNGNGEHGISLQGMDGFDVDWPMCHKNKSGGISLQDDRTALAPSQNGALGGYYRGNYVGIRFIDTNRNILIKAGTTAIYNRDVQIRFNDLADSGRTSDMIVGRHLNLQPCPLGVVNADCTGAAPKPWMVNSNDSTRINITHKENMTPEFTGEQMAANGAISKPTFPGTHIYLNETSPTVHIDPSLELYLVRFWNGSNHLTGTYTTLMRDGMIATFCANDVGGFRILHNSSQAGMAKFWLVGGGTTPHVDLSHHSCITFRAQGIVWYELSRSIF